MHSNSATVFSLYFSFLIHLIFSFDMKPLSDMSMAGLCSNFKGIGHLKMKMLCSISYSNFVIPGPNAFCIKLLLVLFYSTRTMKKADMV